MNIRNGQSIYFVKRIAFSIYQILGLLRHGQRLTRMLSGFIRVARDVWYSLLSLYYSLRGAMT
jgi:hypothetical protein